jgi:hypothetical protein
MSEVGGKFLTGVSFFCCTGVSFLGLVLEKGAGFCYANSNPTTRRGGRPAPPACGRIGSPASLSAGARRRQYPIRAITGTMVTPARPSIPLDLPHEAG